MCAARCIHCVCGNVMSYNVVHYLTHKESQRCVSVCVYNFGQFATYICHIGTTAQVLASMCAESSIACDTGWGSFGML